MTERPPQVTPQPAPASAPPPPRRDGCLTAIMVIVGIVLLLPGICALIFGGFALTQKHFDSFFSGFIVTGLLVGFGGVMMIRAAIRGPRP